VIKLFKSRLPTRDELVRVYAVAAFLVYSWSMYWSFWRIPSWLKYLDIVSILSIYAYAFVVNFIESISLLFLIVGVSVFLPQEWWKKEFVSKGFVLLVVVWGSALIHMYVYRDPDSQKIFLKNQLVWWICTLIVAVLFTWMAGWSLLINRSLTALADNLSVFLYVYIPLTVAAVFVVIVRIFL